MALTTDQMAQELAGAGYNGPTDPGSIVAAYQRTATPADLAASGLASSMPQQSAGYVPGAFDPNAFAAKITSAMGPISQATSGVTAAELAQRKAQFDATLEWQKQMWANQGMPELVIKQQAQALAQREFEAQHALAEQNLQLAQQQQQIGQAQFQQTLANRAGEFAYERAQAESQYARSQAQQESQFGRTFGLQQGQLGMDYLKTAASMGGPADVFQADDFTRGAAASGQTPAFLRALQGNTGMPVFGATSGTAPQALTPGVIANRLMTGAVGGQNNAALGAIGGIAQAGGGALGPQAIESLNPDELAAMGSGFKKLGYSLPAFLNQYQQSRIQQGAAQAA